MVDFGATSSMDEGRDDGFNGRLERVTFSFGPNQKIEGVMTVTDLSSTSGPAAKHSPDHIHRQLREPESVPPSSEQTDATPSANQVEYGPVPKGMTFRMFINSKPY